AISRQLVEQDPSNAGWQEALGGALRRVGEVLQAQGEQEPARAAFEEGLTIVRSEQCQLAAGFGNYTREVRLIVQALSKPEGEKKDCPLTSYRPLTTIWGAIVSR